MTSKEAILGQLRANKLAGEFLLPTLPRFDIEDDDDPLELFLCNLASMGGSGHRLGPIDSLLSGLDAKVVASAVPEYTGHRDLHLIRQPRELADVDVAIVRAVFGVAETGSVLLTAEALVVNAVAYLAQHLIVLLDPAQIILTLQDAYLRHEFRDQPYACFHTGPSATADIEGVLIHGAQGVRSLSVLLLA